MANRQDLEDKIEDLDAKQAGAQEEIQQMTGEEQLRTSPDPSHEKIRNEKDLPTPDPDHLPPEDGGNQTDPSEIVTNQDAFDKAKLDNPAAVKAAEEEAKGDDTPAKPATLGDTSKRK